MRDMLASLPQMQETKDKLSLHLTMAQDCMNRFEKSNLPSQAMVEQNCATRLTPEGQKPRTLVEEMVPLLDDRSVSNVDKVRIIALYIMYCEGVPDEDRKRLFQHARLTLHEMDAVNNLVHLGARVVKDPANSGWDAWFKKGKRRQQTGENEYELSRYQPLVKLMLEVSTRRSASFAFSRPPYRRGSACLLTNAGPLCEQARSINLPVRARRASRKPIFHDALQSSRERNRAGLSLGASGCLRPRRASST